MKAMPYLQAQGPIDWAQFVATCWDHRPVVFRRHGAAPYPLDAALAAAASAARTANGDEQACRFVLDDRQRRQPGAWLPRHEDATFERYAQRILREGGGRSYALIVNEFHRHDRRIWEGGRRFFQGLFAQVGLPSTGAITTLFHGNYERTPVGVHKDRFATFVFVLQGRKRMRFWPTRPWQDAVATRVDYAEHLADSFAIDVGPGDLLYWPAAYYHVGETLGVEVATSVNVGIPRDGHALLYDFDAIVRAADAVDAQAAAAGDACGDDAGAADQVAGALATVRRLATPAALRSAASAGYLALRTGGGFVPPPPASPVAPLHAQGRWRLADPSFPLAWMHDGDSALCGAAGHVRRVEGFDDRAAALLRRFDSGAGVGVAELLAPFAGTAPEASATGVTLQQTQARALLEWLVSTRALVPASASASTRDGGADAHAVSCRRGLS
ncbi:cupin domain-containing protein [Luteimonas sp. TWI1437]|uniref:JmjC domain-containing protein n=1 Tax=unclassified Luteimonas TaxID=2629088 RepID=UPI00320A6BE0